MEQKILGNIHSVESFGSADGPGVRYIIFLKGCQMRCKYCHNPDTWTMAGGTEMTVQELLEEYDKKAPFYKTGGITATGGEPMVQIDFLTELFTAAHNRGINTCLDTSGVTFRPDDPEYLKKTDKLLEVTDLVMLDIKHIDPIEHMKLCKQPNDNILAFAKYLNEVNLDDRQIYFVNQIINYIVKNGMLADFKVLQETPFTDQGEVSDVFEDAVMWLDIMKIIKSINANAYAA